MKKESIFPTGIAVGGGLTKREYFSVKLLQSMLADDANAKKPVEPVKDMVLAAILLADALLEALDGKD